MTEGTLLLRQVHPSFIQEGKVTSQVFRPTPKDEDKLSVYNGDLITAEDSFVHFTGSTGFHSAGVLAVTKGECETQALSVYADGAPHPAHVSIDFSGKPKPEIEKIAKVLRRRAEERGWLYRPVPV